MGSLSCAFTFVPDGISPAPTGFSVALSPANLTFTGAASPIACSGLPDGIAQTAIVTAVNAAGNGSVSTASAPATPSGSPTTPTAPGQVLTVVAVAGNSQATLTWATPLSDGGSAITGYIATDSATGLTQSFGVVLTGNFTTGVVNGIARTYQVAAVNIAGTGTASLPSNSVTPVAGVGAPTAPQNLTLTNQEPNAASLSFTAAVAGLNPLANVKVYRDTIAKDGTVASTTSFLISSTATTYHDTTATNTTTPGNDPEPFVTATTYKYRISALDNVGTESAINASCKMWMFQAGSDNFNCANVNNLNFNGTQSMLDTSVHQVGSTGSIKVFGGTGAFQPISANPFLTNMTPTQYCGEIGAFSYFSFDILWWANGATVTISHIARVSPPANGGTGDNFNNAAAICGGNSTTAFGPAAVAGQWAHYKIPFVGAQGAALEIGYGSFAGSISGTSLVVTGSLTGTTLNGSDMLFGPGITNGNEGSHVSQPFIRGTYVGNPFGNPSSGVAGTYVIAPSQGTGSGTYTHQRTNFYKTAWIPSSAGPTFWLDNIGWSTD